MQFLRKCWMPLVYSDALRDKPVCIRVLGTKVVAFRDSAGHAAALEDRCAHRGVALSEGRVIGDHIECPYHGWRYNTSGRCVKVPSLLPEARVPSVEVPTYRTREQDGLVWFVLDDEPWRPEPPPRRYPSARSRLSMVEIEGNYVHLMENLVDNPHAGFIHAGLIRNEPTQRVSAEITETATGVVIRTRGEKSNNSLLFRLLGKRGEEVDHVEEYSAPNEMVSVYSQLGHAAGVQSFIVPVDENRTRWFFRTFLDFGLPTAAIFPLYRRIVFRILMQDAQVVRKVHEQASLWPDRAIASTGSDTPSVRVARAARAFAADGPAPDGKAHSRTIEYLL